MPELPEVETIVNDLNKKILKNKIISININLKKIIKSPILEFTSTLKNNSFKNIIRRGKLIIFELIKKNKFLLIHLIMTGQLIYQKNKEITAGGHGENKDLIKLPNKYSHLIFNFINGGKLFFNDQRQFGVVKLVNQKQLEEYLINFGVEPLSKDFTLKKLQDVLKNKKVNIKSFLLNQKHIVGIGNIYADEILFASLILPTRKVYSLSQKEIKKLYNNIKKILEKAINARGTTFNNYRDSDGNKGNFINLLKVYQRQGKICLKCKKATIQKDKVAGRGTHFCKICQK